MTDPRNVEDVQADLTAARARVAALQDELTTAATPVDVLARLPQYGFITLRGLGTRIEVSTGEGLMGRFKPGQVREAVKAWLIAQGDDGTTRP